MKLLRVCLREYADTQAYPSKRLLSKDDPEWKRERREGENMPPGPYELFADYEKQVVRVDGDEMPFSLVGFMRPDTSTVAVYIELNKRAEEKHGMPARVECDKCGEPFDTPQKLGGHKRHCKGRVQ